MLTAKLSRKEIFLQEGRTGSLILPTGAKTPQWTEDKMFGSMRVEVVPDNDAEAHPDIPKDVLEELGPHDVLMSRVGHMMYIRAANWERLKHRFPVLQS